MSRTALSVLFLSSLSLGCGPAPDGDPIEISAVQSQGVITSGVVDIDAMAANIQADLSGNAVGYAYAIVKNGVLTRTGSGGLARRPVEAGGSMSMNSLRRLQVASVTKPITAVAVLQLLEASGKTVDDPISPYIPAGWVKGLGINGLSFRHLLTHTSGFDQAYQALSPADQALWDNDWDGLQFVVSNGATPGAAYGYRNANFALLRVLIPALWKASPLNPGIGAITEGNHGPLYMSYLQQYIFTPAGVASVACESQDPTYPSAYGYDVSDPNEGGRSGNATDGCGGHAGLHLSARDLAAFMAHTRYNNAVLSPAMRQVMDDGKLGWDPGSDVAPSRVDKFYHGGDWSVQGRAWHTCVMKFPQNVEASLVVNSDITTGKLQCTILKDAFNNAL